VANASLSSPGTVNLHGVHRQEQEPVRAVLRMMIDQNESEMLEEREDLRQLRSGAWPADGAPEP
jgi:hypothetical protein